MSFYSGVHVLQRTLVCGSEEGVTPQKSPIFRIKEPYIPHKRVSFAGVKKESLLKRALSIAQKSPVHCTKEPYIPHKRTLYFALRALYFRTKEPHVPHKRALYSAQKSLVCGIGEGVSTQKSPVNCTKEPYISAQQSPILCIQKSPTHAAFPKEH